MVGLKNTKLSRRQVEEKFDKLLIEHDKFLKSWLEANDDENEESEKGEKADSGEGVIRC